MISDWGEVVTRYPYRKVRMDHLLSKEHFVKLAIDFYKEYLQLLILYLLGNVLTRDLLVGH